MLRSVHVDSKNLGERGGGWGLVNKCKTGRRGGKYNIWPVHIEPDLFCGDRVDVNTSFLPVDSQKVLIAKWVLRENILFKIFSLF